MNEKCPTCHGMVERIRGDWKFQEGGLEGVVLKNIEILRCGECGEAPVIPRLESVLRSIALAVALKASALEGREIRYLRKHAERTPSEFAALLGVKPAVLDRWEGGEEAPEPEVDRLIRLVALGLSEGLAGYVPELARSLGQIGPERRPLVVEIDPETMQYRYAA